MDSELRDLLHGWFKKAEHDLKNATIILEASVEDKPFDTVCFHCQQAAEKYLKGYLTFLGVSFPKTHLISTLVDLGSIADPMLAELIVTNELSAYGVIVRYPDDFYMPSEQEASDALNLALLVQKYVLAKIPGFRV